MARYQNPPGSAVRTSLARRIPALIGKFIKRAVLGETRDRSYVLAHDEAVAQLEALAGRDSVTWIGHLTVLLCIDGRRVLTDPWWSSSATPVPGIGPRRYVAPALALDELPRIDTVVVSHSHRDHLDLPTIERLPGRERITAVVPLGLGRFFRERGYGRVEELDWEESVDVDGLRLTALPAIHYSQRVPFKLNDTLWAAFAIEAPSGARIYFGGDSDYGPVHARLAERWGGFDLALLSIGGYPTPGVHCKPEDCVLTGVDLGARALVPLHWGTIYLGEGPPLKLPARFAAAARERGFDEDGVWLMRIGETRPLPAPAAAGERSARK